MVGYSFFQTSTLGMRSNAHALNTIGSNIANVNTGGYKRTDTNFETLISRTLDQNQSDLGGVKPKDYMRIDQQGVITSTTSDLDLAIVGTGFYQLTDSLNSTNPENMFYTRDGSFRIATADETSSVTADDGSTITITNGYLVDKNGYYLLGWAPEADGSFSNTGALQPLRVDSYAFSEIFQSTSTANLSLNLPASNEIISDHAATVLGANTGTENDNLETYTINVVDSNGNVQTATLNFTKSATNQWEVSATTSRAATPQTDTLVIQGTVEAGDTYAVTVNGNTVSYTTTGTEADISEVRNAFVAAINANAIVGNRVTASAGNGPGEITITDNVGATTAQVDTVTISGTVDAGDVYSVVVDGNAVNYTVQTSDATLSDIRDGLLAAITADATVSGLVTAAAGGASGAITLTATTSGTAFSSSASATNIAAGTNDSTAANANTTANTAQVDTIAISGTVETGDQYTVTVDGTPVTYTVQPGDVTISDVRDGLFAAINADGTVGALVTAAAGGPAGALTLTADSAGVAFTSSASAANFGATNDSTASGTTTTANAVQLNTISISGTIDFGDVYTVNVNGNPVSYTVQETDTTISDVRDGLIAAIGADATVGPLVTAAAGGGAGDLTLIASTPGATFTSSASATNRPVGTDDSSATTNTTITNDDGTSMTTSASATEVGAVAQVDTVTLTGTAGDVGDQYSVTVNGYTVTYTTDGTEANLNAIRDALVSQINADANVGGIVNAAAGAAGALVLTAVSSGSTLTTSASVPAQTGTLDNTATLTNTTAAVAVTDDNGVVLGTNTTYQTSAAQTIDFSELGEIIGTNPVTTEFTMSFADGATSTVSLDVSDFTQFGDDFLPYTYSHNGLAAANMTRVTFDSTGHVLGNFDDGTQRLVYKLPLATFTNPNGLDTLNGMVFRASADSGEAETFAADTSGIASFTPYSVELSNVDMADEFTKMMMVQNAYNSNATVFKTVDEMVMVARDLKA